MCGARFAKIPINLQYSLVCGLERAAAAAAYIQGDSGKGIVVAVGSSGCLRVYSVSFRNSVQAYFSTKVVFTEADFLESDGS